MNGPRSSRRVESTDNSETGSLSGVVGMPGSTVPPVAFRVRSPSPRPPSTWSRSLLTGHTAGHRGRFVGIERPLFWCPEGTSENSPALQRWVQSQKVASPDGTAEVQSHTKSFSRPFWTRVQDRVFPGVKTPGYSHDVSPGQWNAGAGFSADVAVRKSAAASPRQLGAISQSSPSGTGTKLRRYP